MQLKEKVTLPFPDFAVWHANTVAAEGAAILDSEMDDIEDDRATY